MHKRSAVLLAVAVSSLLTSGCASSGSARSEADCQVLTMPEVDDLRCLPPPTQRSVTRLDGFCAGELAAYGAPWWRFWE